MGSPVDDALERLDALVVYEAAKDALATMREALEQLRTERDAARVGHRVLLDAQNELIERAKSAEAELERLRRHPDAWSSLGTLLLLVECFLAEAEVQRLREERDGWEKIAESRALYAHKQAARMGAHASAPQPTPVSGVPLAATGKASEGAEDDGGGAK